MRLPTNNIAITLVGIAVTILVVPIVLISAYLLGVARAIRRQRGHSRPARQDRMLSPLEAWSETRLL